MFSPHSTVLRLPSGHGCRSACWPPWWCRPSSSACPFTPIAIISSPSSIPSLLLTSLQAGVPRHQKTSSPALCCSIIFEYSNDATVRENSAPSYC
uniref:Secreted protein n=1 Tax=Macrostomum lignano TaxID=282301 RepID=A0A1I8FUQ6_9PLAT